MIFLKKSISSKRSRVFTDIIISIKKQPVCTTSHIPNDPNYMFEREVRRRLTGQGLQEIITCNLISPKLAQLLPAKDWLKVLHSKSEDYSILRPSLLPSLMEVVKTNLDQKNASLSAFEIGRIHIKQNDLPVEIPMLGVVLYGKNRPHHWDRKPSDIDFYDLKGAIEALFESLSISAISFQRSSHRLFSSKPPGRFAYRWAADRIARRDPSASSGKTGYQTARLLRGTGSRLSHQIAKNPYASASRCLFIQAPSATGPSRCRQNLQYETLFEIIRSFQSPLFEKAELIDLYTMKQENKSSATPRSASPIAIH